MPRAHIIKRTAIQRTPRVMQVEGIFDVAPTQHSTNEWMIDFSFPSNWHIGLIVGPSGSGKTTIARELFDTNMISSWEWGEDTSVLDSFPADMGIKEITALLSSVGFSTPPAWLRPYGDLSNGEQFRVNIARTLAEQPDLAVVDEFTSVVDRTVAQIGSAAIAKTVRKRQQKFVAVSCHYDVMDWLEPDWVYQPHINEFTWGRLRCRPPIDLTIRRVHYSAWDLFRRHHYLNTSLNKSAVCFVAFWRGEPVAFSSWLHFPNRNRLKREHRTVCLPDFQGVGIGNVLSDYIASAIVALGYGAISTTANPAMVQRRNNSPVWKMTAKGRRTHNGGTAWQRNSCAATVAFNRLVYSFRYVGPPMQTKQARLLWDS